MTSAKFFEDCAYLLVWLLTCFVIIPVCFKLSTLTLPSLCSSIFISIHPYASVWLNIWMSCPSPICLGSFLPSHSYYKINNSICRFWPLSPTTCDWEHHSSLLTLPITTLPVIDVAGKLLDLSCVTMDLGRFPSIFFLVLWSLGRSI